MEEAFMVKNEQEANSFVIKTMRITSFFLIFCYVLNLLKIFVIPFKPMTIALIVGMICLWLPTFVVSGLKIQGSWIKYLCMICNIIFVSVMAITLNYHVVLMYIFPIAICSIYFSNRLNMFTVIASNICFIAAQFMGNLLNYTVDKNVESVREIFVYAILPRAIELIAISCIIGILTNRTSKLLRSVMNAEQQQRLLDNIQSLTKQSVKVSNQLVEAMDT